ncbi:MAG: hypothetical protein HN995_09350 [Candidatus Marinimicrobia bacterium]|jgi:uncharacterized membrane-anchored protein YhcB (DUF1043 family)|nr:hypothetical protein [Candidatus Neomarinimicrobiota bacterium]MBT3576702.1 hypothetical protein [Candidatus Neomarinimicrobiota bacterium]MBT3678674.1 hypothetical protein [Candidatus Neomarinimicrobiota bacterium]MBT3952215.1 hypothetical protein [Candidatus Neomarinimicrobiota bacterium]MBT4252938.1 hypothetical protein [Candidatus Neomarinimicrobiota bacterium]
MSLAAAIGYVIGIMIFAIIFRLRRKRMMDKHTEKFESKISSSDKGNIND